MRGMQGSRPHRMGAILDKLVLLFSFLPLILCLLHPVPAPRNFVPPPTFQHTQIKALPFMIFFERISKVQNSCLKYREYKEHLKTQIYQLIFHSLVLSRPLEKLPAYTRPFSLKHFCASFLRIGDPLT